jgi:general secretion pathway protein K
MMGGGQEQHKSGGFALLVVILIMLITSFLASQLIMQVRTDLQISTNIQQRVVGRMLAEGGVSLALFRLIDKPGIDFEEKIGGPVFLRGRTYETVLSTGKMEYYAVSESGKIDLNKTNVVFLKKFLEYHDLAEEEVDVVIDSLLDWRDKDNLHRLNGAEKDYYEELEKPYIPRNGKIEDPAEFFLIRGTESLRGKFDPYAVFTVNNSNASGKININNLSPEMLAFLVGGDEDLIERYREEQELAAPGGVTTTTLQDIVGSGVYTSLSSYLIFSSAVGKIYSIVARGYAGGFSIDAPEGEEEIEGEEGDNLPRHQPVTKIRVLVDTTKKEFQYLSWREQYG